MRQYSKENREVSVLSKCECDFCSTPITFVANEQKPKSIRVREKYSGWETDRKDDMDFCNFECLSKYMEKEYTLLGLGSPYQVTIKFNPFDFYEIE